MKRKPEKPKGPKVVIFRPWITLRNGKRLYAAAYGLPAWPITVRK